LIGVLQERYGIAKEEAQKRADDWVNTVRDTDAQTTPPKTFTGRS
jgi:hypothetical protein